MSQTLANCTAFIQPVSERDRTTFERRTGLRLIESPKPGVIRVAARRPLHLVLTAYRRIGPGQAPLGIDLAANPLRRELLLEAARTGQQLASARRVPHTQATHDDRSERSRRHRRLARSQLSRRSVAPGDSLSNSRS